MTTFRVLTGDRAGSLIDETDLPELYAYPTPADGRAWVRASMISTVDGAASGKDGLSGSISIPADRVMLSLLRGLTDVVLAGAGTARAEGYRRVEARPAFAQWRAEHGQSPAAAIAVVTGSGDVPDVLTDRPGRVDGVDELIVLTCEAVEADRLSRLRHRLGEANVVVVGDDRVDLPSAVAALADRGLHRVSCEGGPSLLGQLVASDRLDELCLTTSPTLLGGDGPRIAHGPEQALPLRLGHLLQNDEALFARWVVARERGT
ncbi:MAG: pyrimidine reductase family protein [Actinomycetales bacterium]